MMETLVLVADGGHGNFYATDAEMAEFTPWREVKNRHHAGEHRRRTDEGAAHHAEETAFARELAAVIAEATQKREADAIVLVGPAKFLADLEAALPASAAKHVQGRVHKDFAKLERHDLARRVKAALSEG